MDSSNSKRLCRWRSPEDVLKVKETPSSPISVGIVDIVVFNDLKLAYDNLQTENIELRAIIEIMEAKSLRDKSRKKNQDMDNDVHGELENCKHLILRLERELQSTMHDSKLQYDKLEHKRKLFLGLQESLQASAEECLDLRRHLEKAHLELSQLRDEKNTEIKVLDERLIATSHRADIAEKKYAQLMVDRDEATIAQKYKFKRYGADLMYVVTTGVYKRVMSRAIGQWRACTAASVVHQISTRQIEFIKEKLRGERIASVEELRSQMQHTIDKLERALERTQISREALLKRCFNSPYYQKSKVFGAWRSTCFKQMLVSSSERGRELVAKTTQLKQISEKIVTFEKSESAVRRKYCIAMAAVAMLNMLHRLSKHRFSLHRAYRHWSRVLLIKRAKVTEFVDTYNKLSEALEKEQKIANSECSARNRAERKLEAYRDIAGSMSSVIRYQGTLFRCFSSWKQYTYKQKLWRIGNWPELWRLSKLCPDEAERARYSTSDVMHMSADREAGNRTIDMHHHHTTPDRLHTPLRTRSKESSSHPVGSSVGGSNSVLSSSSRWSEVRNTAAGRGERDVYVSDDAWQEPRRHPPPPAQQQMFHSSHRGSSQSSLHPGNSYSDADAEPRERQVAASAIGHLMHLHQPHNPHNQSQRQSSRRSLRGGVEFDASQADEMSEVLGQYDEYANDFEDSEGEEEVYQRGGVLDAGSTMTSNPSTGSLLFTGTIASVRGGTFASTGDFSTATKLFARRGDSSTHPPTRSVTSSGVAGGYDHNSAMGERDTLTLTPAESMSLEDLGNLETYDRQRRNRGSFSPTSAPTSGKQRSREVADASTGASGNSMELTATGEFQSAESMGGQWPEVSGGISGSMSIPQQNADFNTTGVFQSATSLLGRNGRDVDRRGGINDGPGPSLCSDNAETGEFQSATSLFSQNSHIVSSRTSSEETKVRGGGSALPPKAQKGVRESGQNRRNSVA